MGAALDGAQLTQQSGCASQQWIRLPNSVTVSPPARPNSAAFGWLQAVPADLMLTADGRLLRPVSRRYADHLEFLRSANDHLGALANTNVLVVVTTK